MRILKDKSLTKLNTFGIAAKAKYFVNITSKDEFQELYLTPEFRDNKKLVLGGGSNILFSSDFDGLVIHVNIKELSFLSREGGFMTIRVGGGEDWHKFVETCVENNLSRIENLALIPGNVGAAPVQNIGAYGVEQEEYFVELEAFDMESGEFRTFKKEECRFGYRDSIFKHEAKDKFIITSVTYRLSRSFEPVDRYPDINRELDKFSFVQHDLRFLFDLVCRIRRSKLPYPDEIGNAGSFFKNPVISGEQFETLKSKYPALKGFEQPSGKMKVSAGWLIEQCGWKGKRLSPESDAAVAEKHALILVNHGNATGEELLRLAEAIRSSVREKFAIELEFEVNVV